MNPSTDIYQGLHILLVTEDDARGKALTKVLRDHKARVGDLKSGGRDPAALRGIDLAIIDARYAEAAKERLSELRADVRARFASLLTADFEALIKGDGSVLLNQLTEQVAPLVDADVKLTERARSEGNFSGSLAPLGPSRTLRALSMSGHTLLVELRHPTLQASLEVSNELLVSASAARGEKRWEAWSALVRILGLSDAELFVSRRSFTSAMNIMEPVDQALEVAAQERHCSAPQIEEEEAEALRLSQAPAARSVAVGQGAMHDSLPPRGASLNPGYTPPRPPGRPAPAAVASQQRTLLGIRTALPNLGNAPAANDTAAAVASPPVAVPRAREVPRYAHRPGSLASQRPGMTLLGVAPGAIPGLAEMRAQAEAEKARSKAEADPALASAATGAALPAVRIPQGPAAPPAPPARALANSGKVERPGEQSAFDPPTGRMVVGDQLADSLDDLDDLSDELSMAAAPLAAPLPPPRQNLPDSPTDEPDDTEDDAAEADGARSQALTERAPPSSPQEPTAAEPSSTPRDARSALLTRDSDALAKTERPPAPPEAAGGAPAAFDEPPTKNYPIGIDATVLDTGMEPEPEPAGAAGDETLVTKREPVKSKSRVGVLSAGAVLLGLIGLLTHAALRGREPAAPESERDAPAAAPVVAAGPPASAAGPIAAEGAEPHAAEPAQPLAEDPAMVAAAEPADVTPPVGSPVEQAPADAPLAAPTAVSPATSAPTDPGGAPTATSTLPDLLKQGQRLLAERNPGAARPVFEQALTLDASNPHAREGLADALLRSNEPAAALPHVQAATKLRPKRARYQVLLGDVLAAMGKLDDAQTAWKKALTLDPNDNEAKQRLSR